MKLSAAIRIGSMTSRQVIGILDDGNNGRCALGAAASIVDGMDFSRASFENNFPILGRLASWKIVTYDRSLGYSNGLSDYPLGSVIVTWNDSGKYTREEIADRVEMIEEAEEHYEKFGRESSCPLKTLTKVS